MTGVELYDRRGMRGGREEGAEGGLYSWPWRPAPAWSRFMVTVVVVVVVVVVVLPSVGERIYVFVPRWMLKSG